MQQKLWESSRLRSWHLPRILLVNCGRSKPDLACEIIFNDILNTGSLPPEFKRTKIVAILKPGKPQELPKSYRPIALLSCCYKLLERLLHNRICPAVDVLIPVEQAGLRSGSSCTDQGLIPDNPHRSGV
ncbi:hypothetical protein JTB14_022858 [Gonioctena quinquepunctata]|nr:hypothetical protein JTB14_022858 [Gonioctena quinquepunctata]